MLSYSNPILKIYLKGNKIFMCIQRLHHYLLFMIVNPELHNFYIYWQSKHIIKKINLLVTQYNPHKMFCMIVYIFYKGIIDFLKFILKICKIGSIIIFTNKEIIYKGVWLFSHLMSMNCIAINNSTSWNFYFPSWIHFYSVVYQKNMYWTILRWYKVSTHFHGRAFPFNTHEENNGCHGHNCRQYISQKPVSIAYLTEFLFLRILGK